MPAYTLKMYRDGRGPSDPMIEVGTLTFESLDEGAAVRVAAKMYPDRLTDCDYAVLRNARGGRIWQKRN
jgi:hypothetical protein